MDLNDYADLCHEANARWWRNPGQKSGAVSALSQYLDTVGFYLQNNEGRLYCHACGNVPSRDGHREGCKAVSLAHSLGREIDDRGHLTSVPEERPVRNKGEQLMLIVSEISEAMEGARKDLADDKLPHRKMEEVELADALIRIFDYAGGHGLDIDGAFNEKMAYNATRHDHTDEGRLAEGGKKW